MKKNKKSLVLILAIFSLFFWGANAVYGKTIGYGAKGEKVEEIQKTLKKLGFYEGTEDGLYGYSTWDSVKRFQKYNGLRADGEAGEETLKALGLYDNMLGENFVLHEEDLQILNDPDTALLAAYIYSEARGQSYVEQVACGAVMVNRMKSPYFPDTLRGVIYQTDEVNLVIHNQKKLDSDHRVYEAARDALNGWDPTGGALYIYQRSSLPKGVKPTKTIGKLKFVHQEAYQQTNGDTK